jgi:large subunit ribosomal protein L15
MNLHELYPFPEERQGRKRVGRGPGSGLGGTSGRGHKGQLSRSGGKSKKGFEGGQMPLQRRLPKHGFKNHFREEYEVVNVGCLLAAFEGKSEITLTDIYERGLCKQDSAVKVLGSGEVTAAVTIEAHRFSASAIEKISKAGGSTTALEGK